MGVAYLSSLSVIVTLLGIICVDGACVGSVCMTSADVENSLDAAVSTLKEEGQSAVETVKRQGEYVIEAVKSEGQSGLETIVREGEPIIVALKKGGESALETVGREGQIAIQTLERGGESLVQGIEDFYRTSSGQCQCISYNCGCCAHIEEPEIELNSTICANASYLAQDYGISLTVTVNQYTIFNETVSVRNPPPVCLGVPYVKEWAEACVRLHDIDATKSHLHACVRLEVRMKRLVIAKYELGCFDVGPRIEAELKPGFVDQYPSVVLL